MFLNLFIHLTCWYGKSSQLRFTNDVFDVCGWLFWQIATWYWLLHWIVSCCLGHCSFYVIFLALHSVLPYNFIPNLWKQSCRKHTGVYILQEAVQYNLTCPKAESKFNKKQLILFRITSSFMNWKSLSNRLLDIK